MRINLNSKIEEKSLDSSLVDPALKMQSININAYFGQKQALKNINLPIITNAVTAIIGPSGCGKSTFIRCLNRMHELVPGAKMSGKVLLDGKKHFYYTPFTLCTKKRGEECDLMN